MKKKEENSETNDFMSHSSQYVRRFECETKRGTQDKQKQHKKKKTNIAKKG